MAVTTAPPETSVMDIPFLIRGRVVPPGDHAVEFGGRVGARFRTPDPKRYAGQLVLADPSELRDLHETPIDEIIDFLAELGPRLTLDENPLVQAAFHLALDAGELTEPVLRAVYEEFPYQFSRARLNGMVEKTIGKAYLDGWVERGRPGGHRYGCGRSAPETSTSSPGTYRSRRRSPWSVPRCARRTA